MKKRFFLLLTVFCLLNPIAVGVCAPRANRAEKTPSPFGGRIGDHPSGNSATVYALGACIGDNPNGDTVTVYALGDGLVAAVPNPEPSKTVEDLHFALRGLSYRKQALNDAAGSYRLCFANGDCFELLEMHGEGPDRIRLTNGAEAECTPEAREMISALLAERVVRIPEPLGADTERQMAADYLGIYGEPLHYNACYGSYGDCAVLYLDSVLCSIGEITIDGIQFRNHNLFTLLVWRNHTFCTLEEAYRNGFISRSDLQKIAVIHILHHNRITEWNTDPNDIYVK